jgi:tetratricopeptide (TPR) repeat protein
MWRGFAGAFAAMVLGLGVTASAAPSATDALAARWTAALQHIDGGKCDGAEWTAISQDPAFPKLASAMRSATFINLAACIGGDRTHEWRALAAKEPDAPPLAFALLFLEAVNRRDTEAALADLEADLRAAKRLGMSFVITNDDGIYYLYRRLDGDLASKRRLLAVLDAGDWTPSDSAQDPSAYWADFSTLLLEAGDPVKAARVAKKVTAADILLGLRLDRRFAGMVKADPAMFDMEYAAYAELQRLQKLYAAAADNDNGAYAVIEALRDLGRDDDAVAFADGVLKKDRIVDDKGLDYRNWIEDRRVYALIGLGRFDEAIAAERLAAGRKERGGPNVSQVINLAEMLIDQGRFQEALDLLGPMDEPGRTSPLGHGFVVQTRVCAFNGLGRSKDQADALAYTAAHVGDNRPARLRALLCANDIPGAARLMVDWLGDPVARRRALVELCTAPARPLGSFQAVLSDRYRKVRADPAVVAAIAKVGHTEALRTVGANWPEFP